jgi:hypothetical protein
MTHIVLGRTLRKLPDPTGGSCVCPLCRQLPASRADNTESSDWANAGNVSLTGRERGRGAAARAEKVDMVYRAPMTELLEQAIEKVRKLPEAEQDEAAAMLLSVASKADDTVELDEATRAAVREGRDQARQGRFASDKDMAAFFRRHGVKRWQA